MEKVPAIWFPTVRCGTGTDVFTETLVVGLRRIGLRAEINWLPLRAEYAPWTVPTLKTPSWANVAHINTWLHPRFVPTELPVVATIHHSIHEPAFNQYKGRLQAIYHRHWIRNIERTNMKRANLLTATSKFAANSARDNIANQSIRVVYNGIDTERFHPPKRYQMQDTFRLLFVGSWMPRKGIDLLAPIMKELGDAFFLNYTGGPDAEKDKVNMPNNTHDLGRLTADKVAIALRNSDALLLPSRSEGFGLVVAEAMASGLPVICTRGSSLSEVVNDGKTGILCDQDSIATFVMAAKTLRKELTTSSDYRNSAREHAITNFSIEKMVGNYASMYLELLKNNMSDHPTVKFR